MKKLIFLILLVLLVATGLTSRHFFETEHLSLPATEVKEQWLKARPEYSLLQSGDLIFRHGRGFISNALMGFGRLEKKYSHAGIVSVENGRVFVYHAIGGEENVTNKLRKDPLQVFCNPASVHAFGIYRTDLGEKKLQSIITLAAKHFNEGLEFDTRFDLKTDDKMYCTEFIYKIFCEVSGDRNYLSLPAVQGIKYVACDDLYANSRTAKIYSYQY